MTAVPQFRAVHNEWNVECKVNSEDEIIPPESSWILFSYKIQKEHFTLPCATTG